MTTSLKIAPGRFDLAVVADIVEPGSRVLDVGCGDGLLLQMLERQKQVDGRGVELSQRGVNDCVAKGLSVIQGDADTDLSDYPEDGFDYVILSQTLQATQRPRVVLDNMLRIGRRAIVSFPNFGHWRDPRLCRTGRRDRRAHRTRRRARPRGRAHQMEGTVARDEPLWRAGHIPA